MPSRVLIVDDEPANCELLTYVIASEQLEPHIETDSRLAYDRFLELTPDIVLLDVQMPHVSGLDLCRRIKHDPEHRFTPVVLVTAFSAIDDRVRGLEAGADDLITKPVEQAVLVAKVRSLLRVKACTDELERAESVLFALARSIESKDPYTRGHCERLAEYSAALGESIGLSGDEITALRRASVVHDIGKVAVPESILLKPARLTPEEYQVMQQHPVVGENICAPLKSFARVLPIIRHHHEKLDGSGYPDRLRGDSIPITARVLEIVDVYDALTTQRPYKRALSSAEALTIMQEEVKRGWWDPALFRQFDRLISGGFSVSAAAACS